MTGRLWRRSGSAFVAALALLTLAPASAAWADAVITVDQPGTNAALTSSAVTIRGSVVSDSPLLNSPKSVTLTMKGQSVAPVKCTDSPCTFSWPLDLPLNGGYDFTVSATDATRLLGIESKAVTQPGHFSVAAPPKRPVLDPPKVTDGRAVELTWSRNTEADLLYYAVFRKDPAGSKPLQIGGKIPQPASGTKVTFTDTTTTFNGGDFSYQVVAVRKGATADAEVSSDASAAGVATVPPPPTTTTVAPPPGSPAAGPTTTVKPGPPNGVDLSGFLSSRAGPVSLPPITVPEPPDPGFQGTLPFGARPPGDDVEEGGADAVLPGTRRSTTSFVTQGAGRPLVPIAGGLVLLLLATHMRLLNRKIKPVAAGDLPVDLHAAPPPAPPEPSIVPEPLAAVEPPAAVEPEPETRFYDVLEQETDWAPEPEPDPEPEEMWAPDVADLDLDDEPEPQPESELDDEFAFELEPRPGPEEIEVVEVVAPRGRRLARSGSR